MRRMLIALPLLLSVATCLALPPAEEGQPEDPAILETKGIKAEISLMNLLNGLYLSGEQLDKLIALADKSAALEARYRKDFVSGSAEYVAGLKTLRDSLYAPTGTDPELKKKAVELEEKHMKAPIDAMNEELGNVEEEARGVLSEAQLAVVEDFKPCLIPPKTLSDPVAVGQLTTTDKEEAALDIMRRMPEDLYQKRRREVVRLVVERGEREKGKIPDDVRGGMESALLKKLDEARKLSDADFGLKKKDYAKDFQLFDDTVVYHQGHKRELGKIHRFLLSGGAARVLRRYKDAVAKAPARTPGAAPAGEEDPAGQKAKARQGALMRFGGGTLQAIKEHVDSGKLSKAEAQRLRQELKALKDSNDPDKQYAGVSRIAARMASLGVTPKLVDATYGRLVYLCHKKCLPPGAIVRPKRPKEGRPNKQGPMDITGLLAMVEQARDYEDSGRLPMAYRTLSQVASYLERFKE